jgi:hypothetical protein
VPGALLGIGAVLNVTLLRGRFRLLDATPAPFSPRLTFGSPDSSASRRAQGGLTLGLEQGELPADFCRLGAPNLSPRIQKLGLRLSSLRKGAKTTTRKGFWRSYLQSVSWLDSAVLLLFGLASCSPFACSFCGSKKDLTSSC